MTMKLGVQEEPAIYKVLLERARGAALPIADLVVSEIAQTGPNGADEFDYIDISSINNQTKRIEAPKRLPSSEAPSRARQHVRANDVLVSMTRPNLNAVALVPSALNGAIGSTGFHVLRANSSTEPAWLFYAVQSPQFIEAMSELVQGALYPAVRPKDIRAFSLFVPAKAAQREVVGYLDEQLSRLDTSVAALHRVQVNLKRYRASVLKSACEGRLVPTEAELARQEGRNFESGVQLLRRILAERSGRQTGKGRKKVSTFADATEPDALPAGWAWATSESLFEWASGVNLTEKDFVSGGVPVYGGNGISGFHSVHNLVTDALVVGRVGALCGNVHLSRGLAWITDNAIYSRAIPSNVCLAFVAMIFDRENLNAKAAGSGQPFVNQKMLNAVGVPLPPLAEQHRIVAEADRRLSLIRVAEAQVTTNLARAQRLRQSILQAAFRTPAQAGQ